MTTDNDIRYKELLSRPSEWMGNEKLAKLRKEIKEIGERIMHEQYLKYEIMYRKKWDEKVAEFLRIYDEFAEKTD
jgi:hypothetical protein